MELRERIQQALQAGEAVTLPDLQALYHECYGETCRRRDRIRYRLQTYLNRHPAPAETLTIMSKKETKARLKSKYAAKGPLLETKEGTIRVSPHNLTDEYAELLRASGRGHFLEEVEVEEDEVPKKAKRGKAQSEGEEAEPASEEV